MLPLRRGAALARASPRRSSPTRRPRRSPRPPRLAEMVVRVAPARAASSRSGDADLPGPAHRSQRRAWRAVRGLTAAERLLKPGGRLAVVTFHSLEDRIVKLFLGARRHGDAQRRGCFRASRPKPSRPSRSRAANRSSRAALRSAANPRSRSAKLRHAVRLQAPARAADEALWALTQPPARRGRHR